MSDDGGLSDEVRERIVGIVSVLVLGLGLLDLFTGIVPGIPFWVIFIIGFAVVVPLVSLLLGVDDDEDEEWWDWTGTGAGKGEEAEPEPEPTDRTDKALEALRERYARGELSDAQFERKLERLLGTDTVENAEEYRREPEEA